MYPCLTEREYHLKTNTYIFFRKIWKNMHIFSKQEAHGPNRSPESPWPILEDFLFLYAFYFLLWPLSTISCNVQGRSLPGNPTGLYLWFRGGNLNSFRDNRTLPIYEGTSVGPPCMVMTCILSDATWQETRICMVFRGGDLSGVWDITTLPV
jgi:hypothetical protein